MKKLSFLLVALSLLGLIKPAPAKNAVIRVLIITGENNHDWKHTSPHFKQVLEESGKFSCEITETPATTLADEAKLKNFDVFLLDYNGKRWGELAESSFLKAVQNGTGVAVVHASNNAFPGWIEYEKLVGLLWREGTGHGAYHPFEVKITDHKHPITRDLPDLKAHPDELYHRLKNSQNVEQRVLATAFSSPDKGGTGQDEPMIIVKTYGKGRVFHTPMGHVGDMTSVKDPQFIVVLRRGVEWAATGDVMTAPVK